MTALCGDKEKFVVAHVKFLSVTYAYFTNNFLNNWFSFEI